MHRPAVVVLTLLALAAVVVAPARAAAGARYVALGDSYAAGLGLTPTDTSANAAACGRSAADYPHQLAATLGLTLVDVTCSGAVVADLAGTQSVTGGSVPAQFDALTADTRLVTLTVGGNDLGFSSIAGFCASLAGPDGPVRGDDEADCRSHYDAGGTDQLAARITGTVQPALTAALAEIHRRAPDAAVLVVDYPAIVPDAANTPSGGCWSSPLQASNALPFTTADLPYLQQTQARLDQALADVATTAGDGVATVYATSLAHTACASVPWVNGVRLSGFSVASNSLHPNAAGAAAMTQAAVPVARSLLAGGSPSAPPPIAVAGDDGGGVPGWVWAVVAVAAVVLLLVAFGAFRVVRRRR